MAPKGVYKTKTPESGAEYVFVDYGSPISLEDTISRSYYEERGYEPDFDILPTKEEYEARHA